MKIQNAGKYFWMLATLAAVVAFGVQFKTIRDLKSEVVLLAAQVARLGANETRVPESKSDDRDPLPQISPVGTGSGRRLTDLEQAVAQLVRASDYLMERGDLPLTTNKLNDLASRLMDGTLGDQERIRALKLLRENDGLTDGVVQNVVAWLQTASNPKTQSELLNQLEGVTNAALKQTLLNLTASESASVREGTVENLRNFRDDPQVEKLLWALAQNDPDNKVRTEAEKAILRGRVSDTTLNSLRQHALTSGVPLEESLLAMRALNRADAGASDVIPAMVARAQNTQDPAERAKIFRAFDDGFKDPALAVPLVNGLQDSNPEVRRNAADALSSHTTDPAVQEWLRYVAENDADPRVRKEAADALPKPKK